ncbi:MAG: hypothetical protein ACKPE6_12140 [Gammaproteobacteria bacterium]
MAGFGLGWALSFLYLVVCGARAADGVSRLTPSTFAADTSQGDGGVPMNLWQGLAALAVAAIAVALFFPRASIRSVARFVAGGIFFASGLLSAALVVGGIALSAQGGGVMLLFAVVPGVVAWISGSMFFASRRYDALRRLPVEQQQRETLADFENTLEASLARLARLRAERNRFLTSPARRAQLDRSIAHEERLLGLLPLLRPGLEDVRNYEQEDEERSA